VKSASAKRGKVSDTPGGENLSVQVSMEAVMQVTEHIHALKIPFKIPISPEKMIDRYVYSYIVFADKITLIDSGVSGTETIIFDYIKKNGRDPQEISLVILSHSHPDHMGSVKVIKEVTQCQVIAHAGEKDWIEDTEKQLKDRPVPGFHALVAGPVALDRLLENGEIADLGGKIRCEVLHTPGHSRGSISLLFPSEETVITGDALPLPNDLPIYEDVVASFNSIIKIKKVRNKEVLLSSWEAPIYENERIEQRIDDGLSYLRRIHETVIRTKIQNKEDLMDLCRQVIKEMGLPPVMATPLVARSFAANLSAMEIENVFRQ
jgi:hydroxyacylglutathione hydrolase